MNRPPARMLVARIAIGVAFLAAIALTIQYGHYRAEGDDRAIWRTVAATMPEWSLWLLAAPLLVPIIREIVDRVRNPMSRIGAFSALGALTMLAHSAVVYVTQRWFGVTDLDVSIAAGAVAVAFLRLPMNLLIFGGIVLFVRGSDATALHRAESEASRKLTTDLTQARLDALRGQLHPHFLFNALNGIAMLIRNGAREEGVQAVTQLSGLLRQVLADDGDELVTLEQELDFIARYVALERLRLGDRLRITFDVALEARAARVPFLLLQPLVENAIRHGVDASPSAGAIQVQARHDADWLLIAVLDDGAGVGPLEGRQHRVGVGLDTTRLRLRQLFDDAFALEVAPRNGRQGTAVQLKLPFFTETFVGKP